MLFTLKVNDGASEFFSHFYLARALPSVFLFGWELKLFTADPFFFFFEAERGETVRMFKLLLKGQALGRYNVEIESYLSTLQGRNVQMFFWAHGLEESH